MKGYILILALMMFACSPEKRQRHIQLDKMKLVMWDLIKAGEWHMQAIVQDTALRKTREEVRLYAQVFAIHGVTKDEFFDSYKYYEAHPVEFKTLIDSIEAYSGREKQAVFDNPAKRP